VEKHIAFKCTCYESALFRPDYVVFSAGGRQILQTGPGMMHF
jgi:hypothetical protein